MWEHVDNPNAPAPFEKIFNEEGGQFARVQAFFSVLRDVVPDPVFKKLTAGHYEYHGENIPIDPQLYEFEEKKVGNGAECNVYKLISLDPKRPTLVIKIDNGVRRDVNTLVERGKKIKSEYEEKREWYQEIPDLIPEEMQFIGKSPRGGRNALFTIQEYFGSADQIHDLFRGYSKAELINILKGDEELGKVFISFARITLERAEKFDQMVDSLGDRNVVLIEQSDGSKALRFLDPHIVKHPKRPESQAEGPLLQADLAFLREVSEAIS